MNNEFDSDILITGVARNCGYHISSEIETLRVAFQYFKKVHWLIIESDSSDTTLLELKKISEKLDNFRFISLGTIEKQFPRRTERIAHCRNRYLEEMEGNALYKHVNFIVVADLDGVNNKINATAIESIWSRNDWSVCTANQIHAYYDIWALRHALWSPNDCWDQYTFLRNHGKSKWEALDAAVYSKMIQIDQYNEWIEVESSFGGLAIYRKEALINIRYKGLTSDGREICEHVPLHRQIKKKGNKIFINPRLINTDTTEHSNQKKTLFRIKEAIRNMIFRLINVIEKP